MASALVYGSVDLINSSRSGELEALYKGEKQDLNPGELKKISLKTIPSANAEDEIADKASVIEIKKLERRKISADKFSRAALEEEMIEEESLYSVIDTGFYMNTITPINVKLVETSAVPSLPELRVKEYPIMAKQKNTLK